MAASQIGKSSRNDGSLAVDDFDAMSGSLSMLQIVTGQRGCQTPNTSDVRQIEGWIFGQTC